jgi:hypothetical protein
MFRGRPLEYGRISKTDSTDAPSSVIRRAMIRPMSPDPQNADALPYLNILQVYQILGRSGRVYAGRTIAWDRDGAPGAFAAPHREDDRVRVDRDEPGAGTRENLEPSAGSQRERQDDGVFEGADIPLAEHGNVAPRVFGARKRLAERVQAEAVVNALVQDAAENAVALDEQYVPAPRVARRNRRREPGRPRR